MAAKAQRAAIYMRDRVMIGGKVPKADVLIVGADRIFGLFLLLRPFRSKERIFPEAATRIRDLNYRNLTLAFKKLIVNNS